MSNLEDKLLEEGEDHVQHVDGPSQFSRRTILIGGAAMATSLALPLESFASQHATGDSPSRPHSGEDSLDMLKVKDGTSIYYKDWGAGQPIVFSHGWPLTADAWDTQMLFFGEQGYRVIAHDRRGHGRSGQSWNGNDMELKGCCPGWPFDRRGRSCPVPRTARKQARIESSPHLSCDAVHARDSRSSRSPHVGL